MTMTNKDLQKLTALAKVEWLQRQQSTFLGFLWTMLNPALIFSVLYVVFVKWVGSKQNDYALFLIVGIVEWNFFSSSTTYTLASLQRRASILNNFPIKLEIPVLAAALSSYFSHLLELAALALLLLLFGRSVNIYWLWVIPIDIICLLLSTGIGMVLACLFIYYRDLERIWGIMLTAGFFLTPVFYPLSIIEPGRRRMLELNPMTAIIENIRLAAEGAPPHTQAMLYSGLCALIAVTAGLLILRRLRSRIGDNL